MTGDFGIVPEKVAMMDHASPAASLILMRGRREGPPHILFVQRGSSLAFAAGAYVFPGGRVDAADRLMATALCPELEPEDGAARIAATRETMEETGIAVGGWPPGGGQIDPGRLIPFARWRPDELVTRRFDTRFYIAEADSSLPLQPVADGVETAHAFWATAVEVLDRCRRGEGRAIFPTRRLLERLARLGSFAAARSEAERLPPRVITPWIERRDDGDWLRIPDDAGYPITAERMDSIIRG